jgi:endoglucanase
MGYKRHVNTATFFVVVTLSANSLFAATAFQNQVGFLTNGQKQMAVIGAEGKEIVFKAENDDEVLKVTAPKAETWAPAGDTAASLKFFYFQRASTALEEEYAGIYAREMGHPDNAVKYHVSTGKADTSATFDGSKGWYDAGDYGKYIVNSGISTYTLLQLYQHNKDYYKQLNLNIPESNNKVPDILDEIRWNLEWMLTMQDPTDGAVFHKLTTLNFSGAIMPQYDDDPRYAIGKTTTATWNFAAVMALAATQKSYDITELPANNISTNRDIVKQTTASNKLIIRNGSVEVQKINNQGQIRYFNLGGKRVR